MWVKRKDLNQDEESRACDLEKLGGDGGLYGTLPREWTVGLSTSGIGYDLLDIDHKVKVAMLLSSSTMGYTY